MTSPELDDLVDLVSIDEPVVLNPGATDDLGHPLPRIGALDCGVKYNILRNLCSRFEVVWCPPDVALETLNDLRFRHCFAPTGLETLPTLARLHLHDTRLHMQLHLDSP